jgi:hypothetical protein
MSVPKCQHTLGRKTNRNGRGTIHRQAALHIPEQTPLPTAGRNRVFSTWFHDAAACCSEPAGDHKPSARLSVAGIEMRKDQRHAAQTATAREFPPAKSQMQGGTSAAPAQKRTRAHSLALRVCIRPALP